MNVIEAILENNRKEIEHIVPGWEWLIQRIEANDVWVAAQSIGNGLPVGVELVSDTHLVCI